MWQEEKHCSVKIVVDIFHQLFYDHKQKRLKEKLAWGDQIGRQFQLFTNFKIDCQLKEDVFPIWQQPNIFWCQKRSFNLRIWNLVLEKTQRETFYLCYISRNEGTLNNAYGYEKNWNFYNYTLISSLRQVKKKILWAAHKLQQYVKYRMEHNNKSNTKVNKNNPEYLVFNNLEDPVQQFNDYYLNSLDTIGVGGSLYVANENKHSDLNSIFLTACTRSDICEIILSVTKKHLLGFDDVLYYNLLLYM